MTSEDRIGYAGLLLRLTLGVMFIAHGLLKVFVFTLPGTVAFFENLGLPGFLAYFTVIAEIGGGALLILGIYVPLVSVGLLPILLGATWAHAGNGWVFSAEGGGWEYPLFLTLSTAVLALVGAGKYAVTLPVPGRLANALNP
ncbi:MAG: DoxX family protein [Rhodospirillales bacterium]